MNQYAVYTYTACWFICFRQAFFMRKYLTALNSKYRFPAFL